MHGGVGRFDELRGADELPEFFISSALLRHVELERVLSGRQMEVDAIKRRSKI